MWIFVSTDWNHLYQRLNCASCGSELTLSRSSPQPTIIRIITQSLWVGMHAVGTPTLWIDCRSSCRLAEARQTLSQGIWHTEAYLVCLAYGATFLTSFFQVDTSVLFMPTEHVILAISCCKKVRFLYCLLMWWLGDEGNSWKITQQITTLCSVWSVYWGHGYLCCDPASVSYLYWCNLKLSHCIMGSYDFSCSSSEYMFVFMGVHVCKSVIDKYFVLCLLDVIV